ncbi:hypothetical protein HID58_048200, partial [Brassica napus]
SFDYLSCFGNLWLTYLQFLLISNLDVAHPWWSCGSSVFGKLEKLNVVVNLTFKVMFVIVLNSSLHRCEPSSHLPVTLEGAGSKFSMSGFDITRLSDFSLMIQLSNSIDNRTVSPIPEEHFQFRYRSELFGLADTNTQLLENL